MKVFTGNPTHVNRPSDRWADMVSFVLGSLFGLVAIVVVGSEALYHVGRRFGVLADTGSADLWGSLGISTAAGLIAAAFLAGSPKEIGMALLRGITKRFGNGGTTDAP